jgi:hypothetical protein
VVADCWHFNLLVEMSYLLTNPVLMDDSALQQLLGGVRKTPDDKGLEVSLDAYRRAAAA